MNPYVLLIGAILFEVFGSSMMKASNGFKKLVPTVGLVIGMGSSFYLL
ncbi:QacE family quaternary ammonium compound efflux SMR transporter, partial [Listeria monocytogenes]|nr:QacE family quaternary ammonium compound efflux SMR transporter [Listeria monocytogenes]